MSTFAPVRDEALKAIAEKVTHGQRLSAEDGLVLFQTPDLLGLGTLATSTLPTSVFPTAGSAPSAALRRPLRLTSSL
jgi:hypothetical protein